MFKLKFFQKILNKGGEQEMKTKVLRVIGVMVLALSVGSLCLAADSTTITVNASIPTQNPQLDVTVSRVIPADCTGQNDTNWTIDSAVNLGTLIWDTTDSVFRASRYYAVDVAVLDNTPTNWTLTHDATTLSNGTDDLDDNLNVAFEKQLDDTTSLPLAKMSYANSDGRAYSEAVLSGGWLRIYYGVSNGIAPGDPNPNGCVIDAVGVTPITMEKSSGAYSGSITLTVTP